MATTARPLTSFLMIRPLRLDVRFGGTVNRADGSATLRPLHLLASRAPNLSPQIGARLPGGYQREQRRLWQFINEFDQWRLKPGPQREAMEQEFSSYLDYIKDPELKKKLTPDYNLGCTRILKSDRNYYEAVQLPNAHIVKGQITSIVPDGVVMADGIQVKLDVLVYATGFDAHAYMRPMNVTGLNGTTIHEAWKEKIYSYGGIALPGFPNLFMLYGPFAPVNNVPVPLGLDQEIACIMRLIGEARARSAAVAPITAATDKFLARLGTAFPGTVRVGGCKNWYTSQQPTPVLWPFPPSEHHRAAGLSQPVHALRAVRAGEQRAGAVRPRPGDCLHHAAHWRGPRPLRRSGTHHRRDGQIPRSHRHRLSRNSPGRWLQELVYQPAAHAGPVALPAERAQGVLRAGARGRFPVYSQRAGRLIAR